MLNRRHGAPHLLLSYIHRTTFLTLRSLYKAIKNCSTFGSRFVQQAYKASHLSCRKEFFTREGHAWERRSRIVSNRRQWTIGQYSYSDWEMKRRRKRKCTSVFAVHVTYKLFIQIRRISTKHDSARTRETAQLFWLSDKDLDFCQLSLLFLPFSPNLLIRLEFGSSLSHCPSLDAAFSTGTPMDSYLTTPSL